MTRRLLLAALLVAPLAAAQPPADLSQSKSYGPSWNQSGAVPGVRTRPTKIDRDVTAVGVGDVAPPLGVQVHLWADVADLKKGSKYELRYQFRVHTKKGEFGPLLGTAARKEGVSFVVAAETAGDGWNGLEASVDVTRKDLSEMTGLPRPEQGKNSHTVLLRVEPHLYDATAGKFLTPGKSPAVVLAAEVWKDGKVFELRTLGEWVSMNRGNTADDSLARLADLDEYDGLASGVDAALERVLEMTDVKADTKAKFIAAIPADRLYWKQNFNLKLVVEKLADGSDETLKAAAEKKLAEAKKAAEGK